ncbi:UNVERIFIED_ORG: serine/threonine-protein phosphatase [Bacillus sp. AZ43]
MLGADYAVVYLADYEQVRLVPLPGDGVPHRAAQPVDESIAGLTFRQVAVDRAPAEPDGHWRLWLPLLDGAERAGVLELGYPSEPSDDDEEHARAFASLIAELTVSRDAYSDVFSRLRRSRAMSLAAEIQWELLPPLTFGSERLALSGALEPSYDIGGDTFDYAVNGDAAELLVLDAVGHGLPAALLAAAAVGAYRNARREGGDLPRISAVMDQVVADHFPGSRFATAVIAQLDLATGVLTWVNAGHAAPLVIRRDGVLEPHGCPSSRPIGLQGRTARECRLQLEPGDRVLLYTDGIVEARSPDGEFFGEERLTEFVIRAEEAGDPPPETLRRLMRSVLAHQGGRLQDDATIVLAEWRTGRHEQLTL